MNKVVQYSKIIALSLVFSLFLSACSKTEEPIGEDPENITACDFVTINLTNSLDQEISNAVINDVSIGDIQAGETIAEICLENLMVDANSIYIALQIIGEYEGQLLGEDFGYCGVGMYLAETGVYNIDITEAYDSGFSFISQ